MKAISVHEYGGPEVLQYEDKELKKPGPGQVLLQIKAIGVNFVDIYFRKGYYPSDRPYTPGWEGSGIVEAVGEGVLAVGVGDRVAFVQACGSYAENCLVEADRLIPLPDDLSFEQGAAFPLQGMTAHYLLHEFRQPKAGDVVLIHAAAGGMGLLLVQWAKQLGAQVFGTVSTKEKAKLAKEAGAEKVILYTEKDFAQEIKSFTNDHGADLILDGVGKTTFQGNLEAAAIRGDIVIYGAASGPADPIQPNSLMARSLSIHGGHLNNFTLTREEMLGRAKSVMAGLRQGWLTLKIDHVLPLSQASEAHRLLENRQTSGKIILTTENSNK